MPQGQRYVAVEYVFAPWCISTNKGISTHWEFAATTQPPTLPVGLGRADVKTQRYFRPARRRKRRDGCGCGRPGADASRRTRGREQLRARRRQSARVAARGREDRRGERGAAQSAGRR